MFDRAEKDLKSHSWKLIMFQRKEGVGVVLSFQSLKKPKKA